MRTLNPETRRGAIQKTIQLLLAAMVGGAIAFETNASPQTAESSAIPP
jgi:hypothetical protein